METIDKHYTWEFLTRIANVPRKYDIVELEILPAERFVRIRFAEPMDTPANAD